MQGGFVGKFTFYRHLSRKKVRLNGCCTKPLRGSFLAALLCPVISGDVLASPWMLAEAHVALPLHLAVPPHCI